MVNPISPNRVLVVDDEPAVLDLLAAIVRQAGYLPHLAGSAEEAIQALRLVASETCLVISDIVMNGMNGLELASWIRSEHPELPVLLVSGYMEESQQTLPPGVQFRKKPISVREIQALVEQSCDTDSPGTTVN